MCNFSAPNSPEATYLLQSKREICETGLWVQDICECRVALNLPLAFLPWIPFSLFSGDSAPARLSSWLFLLHATHNSYVQALALAVPLPTTPFPPGVCLHRLLPQLPQIFAQGHMGKLPLDILCKFQPSLASPVQTASCITLWRPFPAACKLHKGKVGMFCFLFGLVWFPVIFPMPRKVPAKSRRWINTDWINEWMNEYMRRASNSFL